MTTFLRLVQYAHRTRSSSFTLSQPTTTTSTSFTPTSISLFDTTQQQQHQQQRQQNGRRKRKEKTWVQKGTRMMTGVAFSLFAGFLTTQPCMVTCAPSTEEKDQHTTTTIQHAQREGISQISTPHQLQNDDSVAQLTAVITPFMKQLGFGGIVGYSAGYATRTVGRLGLLTVGLGFIGIQTLAYNGIIDVKWAKIEETVKTMVDQNGDGKLDEKDVNIVVQRIMGVLKYGLPSSAGFGAGFLYGIRG